MRVVVVEDFHHGAGDDRTRRALDVAADEVDRATAVLERMRIDPDEEGRRPAWSAVADGEVTMAKTTASGGETGAEAESGSADLHDRLAPAGTTVEAGDDIYVVGPAPAEHAEPRRTAAAVDAVRDRDDAHLVVADADVESLAIVEGAAHDTLRAMLENPGTFDEAVGEDVTHPHVKAAIERAVEVDEALAATPDDEITDADRERWANAQAHETVVRDRALRDRLAASDAEEAVLVRGHAHARVAGQLAGHPAVDRVERAHPPDEERPRLEQGAVSTERYWDRVDDLVRDEGPVLVAEGALDGAFEWVDGDALRSAARDGPAEGRLVDALGEPAFLDHVGGGESRALDGDQPGHDA